MSATPGGKEKTASSKSLVSSMIRVLSALTPAGVGNSQSQENQDLDRDPEPDSDSQEGEDRDPNFSQRQMCERYIVSIR